MRGVINGSRAWNHMQPRDLRNVICLFLLILLVGQAASADTADSWVESGNADYNQGNYGKALSAYEKAIDLDPYHAVAWSNKGAALTGLGRYTEGLAASEKAIALDPVQITALATNQGNAWTNKGMALEGLGRLDEALAAYNTSISLEPGDATTWNNKAAVLNYLNRYEEALAASEKAITLDPFLALAWGNKGISLYGLGRLDDALVANDRSLSLDPTFAMAWNNRAGVLNELQRYDEGLAASEKAIALDPFLALAWGNKGISLYRLERYNESLAASEKAIRLDPDYTNAWNNRGVALGNLGRLEDALAALDRAVSLDPTMATAWSNRADVLMKMGRTEEAIASSQKAHELDPSFPVKTADGDPGPGSGIAGSLIFAIFIVALAGIVLVYRRRTLRPRGEAVKPAVEPRGPGPLVSARQVPRNGLPETGTGYDVFLSHAKEDTAVAETVCRALEDRGIRCWTASRDIVPGMVEGEAIMDAISRSRLMVVVNSTAASRSAFVVRDLNAAVSHRMGIIPFVIEDMPLSDSLDYLIGSIPGIRAAPIPGESDLANLAVSVRARLKEMTGAVPEAEG
jgi:tetratricopeptide (TPR) repeat protein